MVSGLLHLQHAAHVVLHDNDPVDRDRGTVLQRLEFLIDNILAADRGHFVSIACPQLESILPTEPDIEAALDITLLTRRETGELFEANYIPALVFWWMFYWCFVDLVFTILFA